MSRVQVWAKEDLSRNPLASNISLCFQISVEDYQSVVGESKNLRHLELRRFNCQPHIECFLPKLTSLTIFHCSLTTLPETVCSVTTLITLNVIGNSLKSLPPAIKRLRRLAHLDLSLNCLTSLPPEFCELKRLASLRMDLTELSHLPEPVVALPKLGTLSLSRNPKLKGELSDNIGLLASLTALTLDSNHVTMLPETIGQLTHLQFLSVEHSEIQKLPTSLKECKHLRTLVANNTKVSEVPVYLIELPCLRSCNLTKTHVQQFVGWEDFKGEDCTTSAVLSECSLSIGSVLKPELGTLPSRFCELWALKLTKLLLRLSLVALPPDMGRLVRLKLLDVSNNQLGSLPESLCNLCALVELDVSCNSLTEVPESLANLKQLRKLDLKKNNLRSVPPSLALLHKLRVFTHDATVTLPPCFGVLACLSFPMTEPFGKLHWHPKWHVYCVSPSSRFSVVGQVVFTVFACLYRKGNSGEGWPFPPPEILNYIFSFLRLEQFQKTKQVVDLCW
eukprot:m.28043 g.28043  ORF g.28043 m.28043 type:complete len:505 (+) comp14065_c0_seq1:59-1573(+)